MVKFSTFNFNHLISNTKPVLVFQKPYCMQDDGVVPWQSGIGSTNGRFIPEKE